MVLEGLEESFRTIVNVNQARLGLSDLLNMESLDYSAKLGEILEEDCSLALPSHIIPTEEEAYCDDGQDLLDDIDEFLKKYGMLRRPALISLNTSLVVLWLYHSTLIVLAARFSVVAAVQVQHLRAMHRMSGTKYAVSLETYDDDNRFGTGFTQAEFRSLFNRLLIFQRFPNALQRIEVVALPALEDLISHARVIPAEERVWNNGHFVVAARHMSKHTEYLPGFH